MVGFASACLKVCIATLNRLYRHVEQFALPRRTIYLFNLQIVTFRLVKKSEATSQECQRNRLTCSRLVKTHGFYGCIYRWLWVNCTFIINFHPLFILLKRPKTMFFGVQKHRFYPSKDDVLYAKSYVFTFQNLCFWKMKAVFCPNKRKNFLYLEKVICKEKRNPKVFSNVKKLTICKQLRDEKVKRWKGKWGRIKVKEWKGERVKK